MKTKSTLFILLFSLALINASAQLSGNYTIGGLTPDYATIPDAVSALQTQGVSGPVVLNIRPGTYPGKVDIAAVSGVSATNTITFQSENGDSTGVIITDSSSSSTANYTFHVLGTDYLIVKKVTITRTGTNANSCVISIGADSRYLQILNCIIESNIASGTNLSSAQVYFPLGTANDSSVIFSNNIFRGGSYGIYIQGQFSTPMPLTQIKNNRFISQSSRAIQLTFLLSPVISGNTISPTTTSTTFRGIILRKVNGDYKITENRITGSYGNPIHLDTCNGNPGSAALVANNFIQTIGTGAVRGINVNFCAYLNVYHNSVNINTNSTTGASFYIADNGLSTNINVKNNIFVNSGGGIAMRAGTGGLSCFASCDYNDLWVAANSINLVLLDTSSYTNLAGWQAASSLDANSVSFNPLFLTATDLHLNSTSVNNLATFLTEVPTDIDGETRSITTPDIGADEFTPLSDNIGLLKTFLPYAGVCGDSSTSVAVIIKNFGTGTQTGFSVTADITGSVTQNLTDTYSGSLVTNQIDTLIFTTLINTIGGGNFSITAYSQLAGDQSLINDTITGSFMLYGKPNAPAVSSPQQQCSNNLQVSAIADVGDVLLWYDQPAGGNLLHVGDVLSAAVTTDTVFYVESKKASPTSGCLRITEVQLRTTNFIEIQNLSATTQDYAGWVVAASGNNSNINSVNSTYWNLGIMGPGEVQYKTDNSTDNYWGNNLLLSTTGRSWVMILDPNGVIADFVSINYPADSLLSLNATIAGHPVTVGSEWRGNGISSCPTTTDDNQRIGTYDNNDVSDWTCSAESKGVANASLDTVFIECGIVDCPSERLPIVINILQSFTVNLGPDTFVSTPFSITLDAGPGIPYYFWSTGETTQTITVDTVGTFWISVVDTSGMCSSGDTIVISLNVGIGNDPGDKDFMIYPNPATDKVTIAADESLLQSATISITDLEGRLIHTKEIIRNRKNIVLDLTDFNKGIYIVRLTSGKHDYIKRFTVIR